MLLRPATLADIPKIMALVAESPTAAQWPAAHYEQAILGVQPRRVSLVLEEQVIQAFLIARVLPGEWELENIAVAVASRRKGLGSTVFEEFLQIVRQDGADTVFLEVRESNTGARSFYKKLGFKEAGRRPGYYNHPGEDAIVYKLTLR